MGPLMNHMCAVGVDWPHAHFWHGLPSRPMLTGALLDVEQIQALREMVRTVRKNGIRGNALNSVYACVHIPESLANSAIQPPHMS